MTSRTTLSGSTMPVGLLGEHRNVTTGSCRGEHVANDVEVERKVGGAFAFHHGGAADARQMTVELVGGLEGGDAASGPGIREQQRLQNFVRTVRREHLLGHHAVQIGDRLAELAGGAVGVAMPRDRATVPRSRASRHATGGGSGDSFVLSRIDTDTCGEW